MKVTYIEHMGSDLSVVNAARVSFSKNSKVLSLKDENLLVFLARHKHEMPFAHPHVTLHIKAPIFVARQLGKHQVGFVWSEVSRRYVDSDPEFYTPKVWRKRAPNKKQGSLKEEVDNNPGVNTGAGELTDTVLAQYKWMLEQEVAPELARMVLPQSMYTEWYWTGSLLGWARVVSLRSSGDAQEEVQEIAKGISEVLKGLYPKSWKALMYKGEEQE